MEPEVLKLPHLTELILAARGDSPCDLVLKNCRIINTFTLEILNGEVGIKNGFIAGAGEVEYDGIDIVDLDGAYLAPGFIESHFHVESSLRRPSELARLVVPRGTTCIVADPHEIANVAGVPGIEYFLKDSEGIPLDLFLMAPSCVPATEFETSGARLDAGDIERLYRYPRVIGLGEVMNFPGVINGAPDMMEKILASRGRPIDGHAPMLSGKELCAYIAAGPRSDHECSDEREALEKVRLGMHIMIREGAEPGNLGKLAAIVNEKNLDRFMLCTDDKPPYKLFEEGHVDYLLRQAVLSGLDPVMAIRMVTLNPARYFGFARRGAVAPGYMADLVVTEDLESFRAARVYKSGRLAAENGSSMLKSPSAPPDPAILNTIKIQSLEQEDLTLRFGSAKPAARVMELVRGTILTRHRVEKVPVDDAGSFVFDPETDLAPVFVLERHRGTGNVGKGLVRGFGLKRGALASSLAHDSHNIICVAADSQSAYTAVRTLVDHGGGFCAAVGDRCTGLVDLGIAGLIHEGTYESILEAFKDLEKGITETGCALPHPFFYLSFLSLPVIPELKITDRGLFDVAAFSQVNLEVKT
ncbi:MAG: adenine deaminase [Proteobacteria bacterium]|nr:adenine deaminase [Pseudomonadota bacterium]